MKKNSRDEGRPARKERSEKPAGTRSSRPNDEKPTFRKRTGSSDEKPTYRKRSTDADSKPAYRKRSDNTLDAKPAYKKRSDTGDDKPTYRKRSPNGGDEKPAYRKRSESADSNATFRKKTGGYGDEKPAYRKRSGDDTEKPTYRKRTSDEPSTYRKRNSDDTDKPAYRKRSSDESSYPSTRKAAPPGRPGERNRSFRKEVDEEGNEKPRVFRKKGNADDQPSGRSYKETTGRPERKPYGRRSGDDSTRPVNRRRKTDDETPERKSFPRREEKPAERPRSRRKDENPDSDEKPASRQLSDEELGEKLLARTRKTSDSTPPAKPYTRREPRSEKSTPRNEEQSPRPRSRRTDAESATPPTRRKTSRQDDGEEKPVPFYDFKRMRETADRIKSKRRKKSDDEEKPQKGTVRLNRYIANAGICSRRDADLLIEAGEIRVNGKIVTEMGYQVMPSDVVKYGNRTLNKEKLVYVLLNKPKDFITTTEDPEDRKTVMDLVADAASQRLYPVGRLDRNTTGLLLLTNDGELAEKLTHPSHEIKKVYQVELDKPISQESIDKIREGITLEDGLVKVDALEVVTPDAEVVGIEIHTGRNRIVRRLFEFLGYEVTKLDRTTFAGLTKKDLPRGKWRYLNEKEVVNLKYLL